MTYCVGIKTAQGLVLASDSRTNAGIDQIDLCRKMHTFVTPGERVFILLSSGSLSLTQSVVTLLDADFRGGSGLASSSTFYDAARCVGEQVRRVGDLDREALERDKIPFGINLILGGQIRGEEPQLYLIYAQGNPLRSTVESPYLQIGESKYGRPILDRGVRHNETTLDEAVKYALISLDSTMRSNMAVGPPIDVAVYANDDLRLERQTRLEAAHPHLVAMRAQWEQELRRAVKSLPSLNF
jgi:putative proteasome-type protease